MIILIGLIILIALIILIVIIIKKYGGSSQSSRLPFGKTTAETIGKRGEWLVTQELGRTKEDLQYVVNDLLFKVGQEKSCQIDHVFINENGIWVIETKNYSGLICGNEKWQEWTQVLANGKEKHRFYNPVKQNRTHIHNLSELLKIDEDIVFGAVVFLRSADLSRVSASGVYTIRQIAVIKKTKTGVVLTPEQMKEYYCKLIELKNSNDIDLSEHIKNIRHKQELLQDGICPRCGGRLVLRSGKNGQFYGCSNYPKCKFTKNN